MQRELRRASVFHYLPFGYLPWGDGNGEEQWEAGGPSATYITYLGPPPPHMKSCVPLNHLKNS